MPATYEPIATATLTTSTATITFASIPATYTDLILIVTGTATYDSDSFRIRFNNDTGSNYAWITLTGTGATTASGNASSQTSLPILGQTSSGMSNTLPSFATVNIFNYAGTTRKSLLVENSIDRNGSGDVGRFIMLWNSTSAITEIDLYETSGDMPSGVTATLYGILKA